MPQQIHITDEAYALLEANKGESRSLKFLASEAIRKAYPPKGGRAAIERSLEHSDDEERGLRQMALVCLENAGWDWGKAINSIANMAPVTKRKLEKLIEEEAGI